MLFLGFGAAYVYIGQDYRMGTARSMGPAYFPVVLGGLLVLVGAATLVRGLVRPGQPLRGFAFKEVALILGGTVLYGVLLRGAGLPIALAVMIIVSGLASIHFRWGRFALLAVGLVTFCSLVFIQGLGLPIPLVGWWFQR
jgi:Tripartite tricarboxylate transporter TctB family